MGCHFLLQGNLPDPGIENPFPAWQADSLSLSHQEILRDYYFLSKIRTKERMKCRWRGGGASGCVEFQGGGSWGACSSGPASTLSVSPTGLDSLSQTHFNIKNQHLSVLVTQSCLTLCDPMDYSPLGSSVHGILQARILEWVAISFSRGSS